jgi:hypothetical protein
MLLYRQSQDQVGFHCAIVDIDATHCVITNVPLSLFASDVMRLVHWDHTVTNTHPLAEGLALKFVIDM